MRLSRLPHVRRDPPMVRASVTTLPAGTPARSRAGAQEALAAAPAAAPLAGTSYEATRKINEGGSSEIFLARHVALGKSVVVKLLRKELCDDALFVERMRLEARALGHLQH